MAGAGQHNPMIDKLITWMDQAGIDAGVARRYAASSPVFQMLDLPGPVGEQNIYRLKPKGRVLCRASGAEGMWRQIAACVATGNHPVVACAAAAALAGMPAEIRPAVVAEDAVAGADFDAVLFEGHRDALVALQKAMAERPGPIVPVHAMPMEHSFGWDYPLEFLLTEQSVSVNTAAAGGNASLMSIG